jgi:hypothetical protein
MTTVTKRLRREVACNAEYVRRFASCVSVRGSQCGSPEVSENGETLNEGKGSRICDWTRSAKRERHVRHDASSKKAVINRWPKDHRMH